MQKPPKNFDGPRLLAVHTPAAYQTCRAAHPFRSPPESDLTQRLNMGNTPALPQPLYSTAVRSLVKQTEVRKQYPQRDPIRKRLSATTKTKALNTAFKKALIEIKQRHNFALVFCILTGFE